MGEIDYFDGRFDYDEISAKTRMWTVRTIFHFLDFALSVVSVVYRRAAQYLHTSIRYYTLTSIRYQYLSSCQYMDKKKFLDYSEFPKRTADTLILNKDDEIVSGMDNGISQTESHIEFLSLLKR